MSGGNYFCGRYCMTEFHLELDIVLTNVAGSVRYLVLVANDLE